MCNRLLRVSGFLLLICGAACGGPVSDAISVDNAGEHTDALTLARVIDLDNLYNDPATQTYAGAANAPASSCKTFLSEIVAIGEALGPAISAKNYLAIAAKLPQILAAFKDLFSCVQQEKKSSPQPSASPLPEAPTLPRFEPHINPCVTVIWHGKQGSTCPWLAVP